LKDDAVVRITLVELGLDLAVEIVLFVLGLPVAVSEVEGVEQSAVDDDTAFGALDRKLGNKSEMELSWAIGEQLGESIADLGFIVEVKPGRAG
jgi:hypothetical protein